eukprot:scaffold37158_cov52-Prasinocladus_malaysianus.AAC.2
MQFANIANRVSTYSFSKWRTPKRCVLNLEAVLLYKVASGRRRARLGCAGSICRRPRTQPWSIPQASRHTCCMPGQKHSAHCQPIASQEQRIKGWQHERGAHLQEPVAALIPLRLGNELLGQVVPIEGVDLSICKSTYETDNYIHPREIESLIAGNKAPFLQSGWSICHHNLIQRNLS